MLFIITNIMINTSRLFQLLTDLKRNKEALHFLNYQPQQTFFWSTKDDTLWIEILNTEYKAHKTQGMLQNLCRQIIILNICISIIS